MRRFRATRTVAELATKHELHPTQIAAWKREAVEKLAKVFDEKGSAPRMPHTTPANNVSPAHAKPLQHGLASWYGPGFQGRRTASGEKFNTHRLTAAHRSLPFGTRTRVTNERTGRSVVVRINDRGPFVRGRVIDLSQAAARAIGMSGVARVSLASR